MVYNGTVRDQFEITAWPRRTTIASARLAPGNIWVRNRMRVRIKTELCQGHGMCLLACPRVFQLSDEDGHSYLLTEEVPAELEQSVQQAVQSCPEQAIEIE